MARKHFQNIWSVYFPKNVEKRINPFKNQKARWFCWSSSLQAKIYSDIIGLKFWKINVGKAGACASHESGGRRLKHRHRRNYFLKLQLYWIRMNVFLQTWKLTKLICFLIWTLDIHRIQINCYLQTWKPIKINMIFTV